MSAPSTPVRARLYERGRVIAEDFSAEEIADRLRDHPEAVAWLDFDDPELPDLEAVAAGFGLHPLAVEDAVHDHQRPKLDRYADHLFVNLYAVEFHGAENPGLRKIEISAFVTKRALITVHKAPGHLEKLLARWDADPALAALGGVNFLVYGLLDVVVDTQYATAREIDEAMDTVEDQMLEEGGAPRAVRLRSFALRKSLANLHRVVAPMTDLVDRVGRAGIEPVDDGLRPYYRDVADHAQRAMELTEHARTRITELLDADSTEQGNVLNQVTRKLAAWAAIIAVPTALTGFFGQNLPYPGYDSPAGFVASSVLIVTSAIGLYGYLKHRGWL
ncbi:magnesium transporter CorA family protein [Actinoplanes sp. NPDC024001]|uniref:magnesium transporter CorA family protein n=1 Tax=Actinoplanes sp. NPDC024001 TaxID=3154598 RepID=UPI0033C542D0